MKMGDAEDRTLDRGGFAIPRREPQELTPKRRATARGCMIRVPQRSFARTDGDAGEAEVEQRTR